MNDDDIKSAHFDFFARNGTGCAFAALASRDPQRIDWDAKVVHSSELQHLDSIIQSVIDDPLVSTLSVIFPDINGFGDFATLLKHLNGQTHFLYETLDTEKCRCYRFRVRVRDVESYVSGFAPFEFLPLTRQAPSVSLVMRVAERPDFSWDLKPPTAGLIHVADMDMKGVSDRQLRRMWNNSFLTTAGLLGHKPDEESAAKTTFAVPLDLAKEISL